MTDINKANAQDIAKAAHLDTNKAKDIVHYREKHGPFVSWDDLKSVPGMSPDKIAKLKQAGMTLGGEQFKAQ